MAKKPTLTTVTSGYSSAATINADLQALRDGFDNTLSLDGSLPNAMGADLDLNSNDILNVGTVNAANVTIGGVAISPTETFTSDRTDIKYEFATPAQLVAFNTPGYFTVGDYVKAGGYTYRIVSSGQHFTTAGSDKVKVLDDTVAPEAIGADDTGVSNAHSQINALLADGKNILLTKGSTYLVGAAITIGVSNAQIIGEGTLKRNFDSGNTVIVNGVSNVTLKDFKIDGQRGTYTSSNNFGIFVDWRTTAGENVLIENVTILDEASSGIIALASSGQASSGLTIKNCHVENVGAHGIIAQDYISDVVITENYVKDTSMIVADRPGITASRSGSRVVVSNNIVIGSASAIGSSIHGISIDGTSDATVTGNILEGWNKYAIEIGFVDGFSVTANNIRNCENGIVLSGNESGSLKNVDGVISANSIADCDVYGIYSFMTGATGAVVHDNILVTGNEIRDCGHNGIYLNLTQNAVVTSNSVVSCGQSGIFIQDCPAHYLSGNYVTLNNIETVKTVSSITVSGTTFTATVPAHGYATNDIIAIWGAFPSRYNGHYSITVTGTDTFTYVNTAPGVSPAVGGIECARAPSATGAANAGLRVLWSLFAITNKRENHYGQNFLSRNGFRDFYDISMNGVRGLINDTLWLRERAVYPRPENLTSGVIANVKDTVAMFMNNGKLVFAYNNAGVVNYLMIPLDGATTSWTNSSTAP